MTSIAAIVPCHDEALTIAKVVADLRASLPDAQIYVYDNRSTDGTADIAKRAGAIVRSEGAKGKGNVVRRAFADIDADVYLLIDGDDTYDAAAAPGMIELLESGPFDHVLGVRRQVSATAYRPGHERGNRFFNGFVGLLFGHQVTDMLSGYRVFSRRFVKSFPAVSKEFEIETELTVHAMSLRLPQTEVEVGFRDRPEGSESKLNTVRDGLRILGVILELVRHERPILYHAVLGGILAAVGIGLGIPVIIDFAETGLVPRLPTAILAAAMVGLGAITGLFGLVLEAIRKQRHETARLHYLALPAPPAADVDRR